MSVALLFPGQGSQERGMGRDLAESDRECMDLWKKAERISGLPLREIYWEGEDADMADTRNLQPGLTVTNLALWARLATRLSSGEIGAAAGHSLGEYSALAAAKVLPVDTVLELVSLRGRLMSEADPDGKGAMAALLKLSREQAEACVAQAGRESDEMIRIANYNTPAQFVASGTKAAIERVQDAAKNAKGRAVILPVSGAFHSPLMNEAAAELAKAIDSVGKEKWSKAAFPVYCNAQPEALREPEAIKALLVKQMTSSVYWIDTIRRQFDDGCRSFVECGPKGVLTKMTGPILKEHLPKITEDAAQVWSGISVGSMSDADSFAR